jgi:DNA-binding NarL/FixJ family response regulator
MNILKNIFKPATEKSGIVFIVEDNPAFAKTIQLFLTENFPQIKKAQIFPVGETCVMELDKNPDLIIMDYHLDSKYHDAETGLETIKKIRAAKPKINTLVLSAQEKIDVVIETVKENNCSYIKKDVNAFKKLEEVVTEIYAA